MARASTLERRDFLRRAAILAGAGVTTAVFPRVARAELPPVATAWQLNPSWGYPLGAHGRTSCHCHACIPHAENKLFATEAAAFAGRAHAGCLCQPFEVEIPAAAYAVLFTGSGSVSVDRRDPGIANVLSQTGTPTAPSQNQVKAVIASFSPSTGKEGDQVLLKGAHLSGATSVAFTGASSVRADERAVSFGIDSDTQITVIIPHGSRTGPISVTTPAGTTTTSLVFVVRHERQITLTLGSKRANGTVIADGGFAQVASGVPVRVQHRQNGKWTTLASALTRADGSYQVSGVAGAGRYRAVAKKTTLSSGDICLKAVSTVAKK